jgi:phosphonate transport system ATP-binding protein
MKVVEAENLQKTYPNGIRALNGLTVSIAEGEMVGILGSSGAGKTTFMRLLNGSIKPTAGKLAVFGYNLAGQIAPSRLRRLRREIGAIYQHHNVIPSLSVFQNVLMGKLGQENLAQSLINYFYIAESKRQNVLKYLAAVELSDKLYERVENLSGGQQQRVAVARVLLQQSKLILADEPIASVDARTATNMLEIFSQLNAEKGVTVIMNLHQVDFAIRYCKRILIFEAGRLKYDGSPDGVNQAELYGQTVSPVYSE